MPWSSLTPQERKVIARVAVGETAKQIAIALNIAPRTVEKHIDHARLKVRAKNRVHMVAMAMSDGRLDLFEDLPEYAPAVRTVLPN